MNIVTYIANLTERTHKEIMENKLELAVLKCKLVINHMRMEEVDMDWWEHWVVFDSTSNIIEKDIRLIINGPETNFSNTNIVSKVQLERVLNERSSNQYEKKLEQFQQRENAILIRFKSEASPEMHKLSNELRQFDWCLFKTFNDFGFAPDETLFQNFRSKIIRYDDRIMLMQVKEYALQACNQSHQNEKEVTMYMIKLVLECKPVDRETLEKIQILGDLLNSKWDTITEKDLNILKDNLYKSIFDKRQDQQKIRETMLKCSNNTLMDTLKQIRGETLDHFVENSKPIIYKVSSVTRMKHQQLFFTFEGLEKNPDYRDVSEVHKILSLLNDL